MTSMMLLTSVGPGEKLQESVGHEIGALFLLAVTAITLVMFWKRQFTAFIGFALFAMVIGVFIFQPELISQLGGDAFRWLFVDWVENLN